MNNPKNTRPEAGIRFDTRSTKPKGSDLLAIEQQELESLRLMIAKRTNRILLEEAASCHTSEDFKRLTVQVLANISNDDRPLYDKYTNSLSQEAMRLFYNMPATVLCNFNLSGSTIRDLQCSPKADKPLSKKEFLVMMLTQKDAMPSTDRRKHFDAQLRLYGYEPLDENDEVDRTVLALLEREAAIDAAPVGVANARRALSRVLHAENENKRDKKEEVIQ